MPEYLAPGVYVEEVSFRSKAIDGVSTSTAGFVGATAVGPTEGPRAVTSLTDYERTYGDGCRLSFADVAAPLHNYMWHAARAFFAQGGKRLFVQRVVGERGNRPGAAEYAGVCGLQALARVAEIAVVAAPGSTFGYEDEYGPQARSIMQALVEHAERMRHRIALLDPGDAQKVEQVLAMRNLIDSTYAAFYYPWLRAGEVDVPPSGFVAGIYARNDLSHGVEKAPANEPVHGTVELETVVSEADSEALNARGVNSFRVFDGGEIRVWGARTTSSDPEWKYVNVRRYFAYLEHSIDRGTQWTVFEPNAEPLWAAVRTAITNFLLGEFRRGALAGETPREAFYVKCDRTTMTQNDLDEGQLVCLVGVAPLRPAEFVNIRIGRWTADHGCP
jgi:phage tail sheath protein FI